MCCFCIVNKTYDNYPYDSRRVPTSVALSAISTFITDKYFFSIITFNSLSGRGILVFFVFLFQIYNRLKYPLYTCLQINQQTPLRKEAILDVFTSWHLFLSYSLIVIHK